MSDAAARAIVEEFLEVLNDIAGTHAIAVTGIIRVLDWAEKIELSNRTSESALFVGHGDPNSAQGFSYQRWRLDTLPQRLGPEGDVVRALGQQWVVMVASQWNDHYRKRIADALGVKTNEVADPILADINRMRNDILHHRGIATARNTGRCEVLQWFREGEPIHVMMVHVAEFMREFGMVVSTKELGGGRWEVRETL
jgi:hypothetical protein